MKNRRNYYRILQVQPDAPPEIIRASYRTLMLGLGKHPDLGGSAAEAALVNEAYEVLSDRDKRAAYDDELFRTYTRKTAPVSRKPLVPALCPVCRRAPGREAAAGEICEYCRTPMPSSQRTRRRSFERTRCSAKIVYYTSWPGEAKEGRMIDFSPQGMRFVCGGKLEPGSVLKISTSALEASATVTNVTRESVRGETFYAVGVSFIAVSFAETLGTFLSVSG